MNAQSVIYLPLGFLYTLPTIWMVVLYYNAYGVSCNLKGIKLIVSFVAGIFIAEILSKLLIIQLYKIFIQ